MIIQIKQTKKEAAVPLLINDTVVGFHSFPQPEVAVDEANRSVIVYRANCSVDIPEGYVGLITTGPKFPGKSLEFVNPQLMPSGHYENITAFFKINTDAMPAFFKPEEEVIRIVIIAIEKLDIQLEVFEVNTNEEVLTVNESEPITEEVILEVE